MRFELTDEFKQQLKQYTELKELIKEYNADEVHKGLDIASRILQDLLHEYSKEVGLFRVEWNDNYDKERLILRIRSPTNVNHSFFDEHPEAMDYIIERYPDVEKYSDSILLAKCIRKYNIDEFIEEVDLE